MTARAPNAKRTCWWPGAPTQTAAHSAIDANIAVTIGADVLAGFHPGFAESADGRWAVPAGWLDDVIRAGGSFWHRIITDPVSDDVLSHEYIGRYSPDLLNLALRFRDGVCQAPGCMVPAQRCDIDHRIPHPERPTRADNLGPLRRRHHQMKGHGVLRWSTRPPKPIVYELWRDPINVEYDGPAAALGVRPSRR
jgi:hypothetical protein